MNSLTPSPLGMPVFDAIDPGEAVAVEGEELQPDEPAPVLAVERDVGEVLAVEPLAHPVDVGGERVVGAGGRACRSGRSR